MSSLIAFTPCVDVAFHDHFNNSKLWQNLLSIINILSSMVFYIPAENTCKEISLHPGPAFEVVEIVELLGKVQLLRRIGGGRSRSLSWTKRMRMLQQRLPLIIIDRSQTFPGADRQEQNQSIEKCFHCCARTWSYAHMHMWQSKPRPPH